MRMTFDACQTVECVSVDIRQESRTSFDFSLSMTSGLDQRITLQPEVPNDDRESWNSS